MSNNNSKGGFFKVCPPTLPSPSRYVRLSVFINYFFYFFQKASNLHNAPAAGNDKNEEPEEVATQVLNGGFDHYNFYSIETAVKKLCAIQAALIKITRRIETIEDTLNEMAEGEMVDEEETQAMDEESDDEYELSQKKKRKF